MNRLENKTAIVTGAGGGIGAAITTSFANQGAAVVVVDINEKLCRQVVDYVSAANGRATALVADVAEENTARRAVELAVDTYGGGTGGRHLWRPGRFG